MPQDLIPKPTDASLPSPLRVRQATQQSIEQFLYVLFKRKWIILGALLAFGIAGGVSAWQEPEVRSAVTKILLKPDRISLQISNLTTQAARVPHSPERMKSELEVMRSRDVLIPVAQRLLRAQGHDPSEETVEREARQLLDGISAAAYPGTGVIEVEYRAPTEAEAEHVLGQIVGQYMEHHAVAYGVSDALLDFYALERDHARENLEAAENRFQHWQESAQVVDVDAQITGLLGRLSDQRRQLEAASAEREVAVEDNALLGRLRGELMAADVEIQNLLQRYTSNDRRVREKREQIVLIQRQIATARKSLVGSFASRDSALEQQIAATSRELERLRAQKLEGERMGREIQTHRESFALYEKKLEESRIAAKLDRDELSDLSIIERPHATTYTNRSERTGLFLMASVVGLGIGTLLAVALSFLDRSIRTRRDVEAYLELPVLATIPDLRSTDR